MRAWVPILISGVLGIVAVLLGVWAQARIQATRDKAADEEHRRAAAAKAMIPVLTILQDADPTRLGINANPESYALLQKLRERWEEARAPLLEVSIIHPDKAVRRLARELQTEAYNNITSAGWFVQAVLNPSSVDRATSTQPLKKLTPTHSN